MNRIVCLLALSLAVAPVVGGSLTPAGAPGPTMRTLNEVEARIPIRPEDLPIDISEAGSYYLTGNATLGEGDGAIDILVSNVVVDLNGFTLQGPGLDAPGGGGSGQGIHCIDPATTGVIVKNGTVTDWPAIGVDLHGHDSVVEYVNTRNCSYGISIRNGDVRNCRTSYSEFAGIGFKSGATSGRGTISNCVSSHNTGPGIDAFSTLNCFILKNHCFENGGKGIDAGEKSVIKENLVVSNGTHGIQAPASCQIENNHCDTNGQHGISAGNKSVVKNNNCSNNGNIGISVALNCRVEENYTYGNSVHGIAAGSYSICVKNTSSSNGVSQFVPIGGPGGSFGTIINLSGGGPVPIGTDAWANFIH